MPKCFIRIVRRPHGEAPPGIRDAWIGCVLPVRENEQDTLRGVVSGEIVPIRHYGYPVAWISAMNALERHGGHEAKEWWEDKSRRPDCLVFDLNCAEVLPD